MEFGENRLVNYQGVQEKPYHHSTTPVASDSEDSDVSDNEDEKVSIKLDSSDELLPFSPSNTHENEGVIFLVLTALGATVFSLFLL